MISAVARLVERPSRTAVLGAVALAAVPLLLVAGVSLVLAQTQIEGRIVEQRVALARAAAQRVDSRITDTVAALASVAQTEDVVAPRSPTELGRVLARVTAVNRSLEGLTLFGSDGRGVAGTAAGDADLGDWLRSRVLPTASGPLVSGRLVGAETARSAVGVAVPVLLASGQRGFLATALSTEALSADLGNVVAAGRARPILVDGEGVPLSSPSGGARPASLRGRADVDAALRGETGSGIVAGPDGDELLAAYAPVPSAGWAVVLVESTDDLFGESRRQALLALGVVAATLLSAGGLGWWLGGRLTDAHAREQQARVVAEAAAARTERLRAVTAALSTTLTRDEAADVILSHGIEAVGARAGWVLLLTEDGRELEVLRAVGMPSAILEKWDRFSVDVPMTVTDAARTGEMVVLSSLEEALTRYPNTGDAARLTGNAAWVAAPLRVDRRVIGALGLSFARPRQFGQPERELIETIARQCAQSLERARLYEAEMGSRLAAEQAQRRLQFLASASRVLASSLDYESTLQQVARLAVPELADWCVVDLMEDDGSMRRIAVVHVDPRKQELALELQRRYPRLAPRTRHTTRRVLETGASWVDGDISEQRLIAEARDAEHLALLRGLGFRAEMVVPLTGRDRILGTITLVAATAQARYDADLVALAEELAQRCALAIENALLYREAQEAVRARDEFLSIASHELRTPMTTVRGQAQLLGRTLARGEVDLERIRRQADAIVQGSDRLISLIQDLLDVSRIRVGRLDLRGERLDLADLLRELVRRHEEQGRQDGLGARFRLELPDGPCPIVADGYRIEQVLANLLENAVKYSPDGGEIVVALRPEGGRARLSVDDSGIGIPADALERVFEPFGRASNAEASRIPGMGLGLYISRSIAERHGGRLWAESPGEGHGTRVVLELPLAPEPAAAMPSG